MLRKIRIEHRIWIINLLAVIGMLLMLLVAVKQQYNEMERMKLQEISHLVDVAEGVMIDYQKRVTLGELTETQARAALLERVSAMTYGQYNDYVWVHDSKMNMLAHPSPKLRGANLSELKDVNGKQFFSLLNAEALATGESYMPYYWNRPGSELPQPKITYVRYNAEWDWLIGTGVYVDDIDALFMASLKTLGAISFVVLLLLMLMGWLITNSITRPLDATVNAMREIGSGDGDLTVRLSEKGRDEVTALALHFNAFTNKIQGLVSEVKHSVDSVASAAGQMSATSEQAFQNQARQAQETDHIATAMNEMSASFLDVARNASDASAAATTTDKSTVEGRNNVELATAAIARLAHQVHQSTEVINQLSDDSSNIGTVLDVIRSVSEQTNLLALNAAIEAARAGEAGRGFAVVADEVRSLASRTRESTEEINTMVAQLQARADQAVSVMAASIKETQQTVVAVESTKGSLSAIASAVEHIRDMNHQIASAAEQQAAVAEEINHNIVHLVQLTEENASATEQTRVSSNDLAGLSAHLKQQVAQFKV
ncbi:MAG TPA: methyl-accepting chemotaxis protein [Marinospirillum sp.]|uniref:methyl-accepting chemotaxis protein n=1 Tax=Marinospirillum sp. TaxID=2183934 RepID=UPI002B490D4F|nr:methyl-accepting chemotaxis protein [Marinospirillum sp.]HKM16328.1 methyl-accepting chemotaxis protein [Marinospirillum sp.]